MKTKNQFRSSKMKEIQQIWEMYPDLSLHERLYAVIHPFVKKSLESQDHLHLASVNECARVFEGLFINPKTGMPTADAINWIRRLLTRIKKDKGHPHIRPYTQPFVEVTVDGQEVIRYYITFLMGSKAIKEMNLRLEKQVTGLKEAQKQNKETFNPKKVMKEADEYMAYLELKQREANEKKRRRGRR